MSRGETPATVRHPGEPGNPRCESAKDSVAEMLASGRTLADHPELRDHLHACEDCNSIYRELLLEGTRMRRSLLGLESQSSAGSQGTSRLRRPLLSPLAIARAGFSSTSRGKASWVIMIAVVFYAVVRLTPEPTGAARVGLTALQGSVISNVEALAVGEPERELQRGDFVRTPEGARASLSFGKTLVELAPSSIVQIEEPSTRRLRFESGAFTCTGPLTVTSLFGIVEVDSGAKLWIGPAGLFVESREGRVRAIDSSGERDLPPRAGGQLALAR